HQRFGFVADGREIVDARFHIGHINVDWLLRLEGAEMDGAVAHQCLIDTKREKVLDHLQPRRAGARLVLALAGRIYEVEFRLVHDDATNELAVPKRIPLNGEIHAPGGEEGNGHIAGRLADAHIPDRISAAEEMDVNRSDLTGVERILIEG